MMALEGHMAAGCHDESDVFTCFASICWTEILKSLHASEVPHQLVDLLPQTTGPKENVIKSNKSYPYYTHLK